jgi:hypothetical protein
MAFVVIVRAGLGICDCPCNCEHAVQTIYGRPDAQYGRIEPPAVLMSVNSNTHIMGSSPPPLSLGEISVGRDIHSTSAANLNTGW